MSRQLMDDYIFDIDTIINNALNKGTLVPRAMYNVVINYTDLDMALRGLFKPNILGGDEYDKCLALLQESVHRGVCKNLLTLGLPLVANDGYKKSFVSSIFLWIETSAMHNRLSTVLDLDEFEPSVLVEEEIKSLIDSIVSSFKDIDEDLVDISDFFTYSNTSYVGVNDCVMYKSVQNKVISILRF